ncbi:GatB/YqeY domain-containing protein [Gammaproteobacteria bacterium]
MTDLSASLKERINEDIKTAMRAQDKRRVGVLRLIMAAVKQREVDDRVVVDDPALLGILDKMIKQRRDSVVQYQSGGREDLAQQEIYEIEVIQEYLPRPLTEAELDALINAAVQQAGASSVKDMGKVMAILRAQVQGKADMGEVGARVKGRLSAL